MSDKASHLSYEEIGLEACSQSGSMKAAPTFCIIAGSTLTVCVLAWSAVPFTFSQLVAMAKKKNDGAEQSRRAEIVRNCAARAAQAVAMQEGPGGSLGPQFKPIQKPKGSAAFLATEARFANATEKPASPPGGAVVDSSSAPAPSTARSVEVTVPTDNVPKPTQKLPGERRLDSVMRDTVYPIPGH
jgi:hypothetical protein